VVVQIFQQAITFWLDNEVVKVRGKSGDVLSTLTRGVAHATNATAYKLTKLGGITLSSTADATTTTINVTDETDFATNDYVLIDNEGI
jgi:hypothetical protein